MEYTKQPIDTAQQVALLKKRGLVFANEDEAKEFLGMSGYFRMVNYLRPMEADKTTHDFKHNSTFENAVQLYKFDRSLRDLVFNAISRIEIATRAKIIHHFSLKHGAFWFMEMGLANDERLFLENLNAVDRELRRSKEEFIKEHFKKYSKPMFPPSWKTLEITSFGVLSKMYLNFADNKAKKAVARSLGVPQHVCLESWLASLTILRNCCAHHARIWNRNFAVTPNIPNKLNNKWICNQSVAFNKLYIQLCCIAYLLNIINPENTFASDIALLLAQYPNVDTAAMGFPANWQDEPLWQA